MTVGNPHDRGSERFLPVVKHDAWEEGYAFCKAGQAEIVSALVKACQAALDVVVQFNAKVLECQGRRDADEQIVILLDGLLDNPIWEQAIAKATGGE